MLSQQGAIRIDRALLLQLFTLLHPLCLDYFLDSLLDLFFLQQIVLGFATDRLLHLVQLRLPLLYCLDLSLAQLIVLLRVALQKCLEVGLFMDHGHDHVVWVVMVVPELLLTLMGLL